MPWGRVWTPMDSSPTGRCVLTGATSSFLPNWAADDDIGGPDVGQKRAYWRAQWFRK